ncbi:hypothetical protein ACJIZ3_014183 [Penstemon smallii]|uniref:Uncharacterized protein n=1 Tax=Penstemon smallii TaxID=265156 RepID=A0ABD3RIU0_9LAMI
MPTRWTALTEAEIMPAFDFLTMKLDIVGFDREKETMVLDLLKNRTRTQRYRLHQRFLKHPTEQAALDDKPPKLTKERRLLERCEINRNNRSKLTVLHNQGSRTFVTLLHELGEKTGKQLDKIEFFPPTHCTDGKWTTSECEVRYKSMLDVQAKSIAEGNSKTANECYDKGFGYGPKPPRKNSSANIKKLEEALRDSQIENTRLKERLGAAETQLDEFNARLANQDKILKMILSQHNLQPPTSD